MANILSTKHKPNPDKRWEAVRNLLIVRLDNLGDVLMTTPAIRALKSVVSGRRITLLTSHSGAGIAPFIPEIDEWIEFNAPWVGLPIPASTKATEEMIENIRARSFDGTVIFTTYSQSSLPAAFFTMLAGIPLRAAYAHENPYELLTDWVPDPEPQTLVKHEVERQLLLAGMLGGSTQNLTLSLKIPTASQLEVQEMLHHKLGDNPYVVLHPGASEKRRQWDISGYITVAKQLTKTGKTVVITGTGEETELASQIKKAVPLTHNFTQKLTLPQFAALVKTSTVLITNNTGPAHIAAAVGTPVVVLYARTNLQHTPWGVQAEVLYFDVPCKACDRGICSKKHGKSSCVTPQDVISAVERMIDGNPTQDHNYSYTHFQPV